MLSIQPESGRSAHESSWYCHRRSGDRSMGARVGSATAFATLVAATVLIGGSQGIKLLVPGRRLVDAGVRGDGYLDDLCGLDRDRAQGLQRDYRRDSSHRMIAVAMPRRIAPIAATGSILFEASGRCGPDSGFRACNGCTRWSACPSGESCALDT